MYVLLLPALTPFILLGTPMGLAWSAQTGPGPYRPRPANETSEMGEPWTSDRSSRARRR